MNNYEKVVLTYKIEGAIIKRGKYELKKKKLIVKEPPSYSDCKVIVVLSKAFINWAMSRKSRPDKNKFYAAWANWFRMSMSGRLHWHIVRYARDFRAISFEYKII